MLSLKVVAVCTSSGSGNLSPVGKDSKAELPRNRGECGMAIGGKEEEEWEYGEKQVLVARQGLHLFYHGILLMSCFFYNILSVC